MKKYSPLISVVCATHNRASIIHHAINSVLWQTYQNWELIVVADGCTDMTTSIVETYIDPRIKLYDEKKFGYYTHVRNFGIEKSKGELLCFRDDDGAWHPKFMEEMIKPHATQDVLVTYCGRANFHNYKLSKIKDSESLLMNIPDTKAKLKQWQGSETLADEVDVGDIMVKKVALGGKGFSEGLDNPGYCSDAKLIDRIMKENRHGKIVMIPKYLHMYFAKHDGREQMTYAKLANREKGSYDNELEKTWNY